MTRTPIRLKIGWGITAPAASSTGSEVGPDTEAEFSTNSEVGPNTKAGLSEGSEAEPNTVIACSPDRTRGLRSRKNQSRQVRQPICRPGGDFSRNSVATTSAPPNAENARFTPQQEACSRATRTSTRFDPQSTPRYCPIPFRERPVPSSTQNRMGHYSSRGLFNRFRSWA
jgi:hypothetical protein